MSKKTTKELVLEGRDEGKVVFLQYDGSGFAVISAPVDEFIKQPADGILYDLNRLEEITLTYIDDPKWVNDFAVALTIRALKDKLEAMERANPSCGLDGCLWEKIVAAQEDDLSKLPTQQKLTEEDMEAH